VVNIWNSLLDYIVDFNCVEVFKKYLDKFDWRTGVTRIRDPSKFSLE